MPCPEPDPPVSDTLWIALGSTGGGVASVVAVLSYLRLRGESVLVKREKTLASAITMAVAPLQHLVSGLENAVAALTEALDVVRVSGMAATGQIDGLLRKMDVIETKMDVFWRNVALDMARTLHSPHAERAHVDKLLEDLVDETITLAGRAELKQILEYMRDYHPGTPADFPIHPGEQVAAVILLRTMEYA
jgi:hypothetical protein